MSCHRASHPQQPLARRLIVKLSKMLMFPEVLRLRQPRSGASSDAPPYLVRSNAIRQNQSLRAANLTSTF